MAFETFFGNNIFAGSRIGAAPSRQEDRLSDFYGE